MGKCEIGFKKTPLFKNSVGSSTYGNGLSGNVVWYADIIGDENGRYLVRPTTNVNGGKAEQIFNPLSFWVNKTDCRKVVIDKPSVSTGSLVLNNGDVLRLTDEKGKHVGDLVFKKK